MKRRQLVLSLVSLAAGSRLLGAGLAGPRAALAQESEATETEMHTIGVEDAPIQIIEYASLTCPHCAAFHGEVYPDLKKDWITPGKAKLEFRHFPLDGLALQAAALSECFSGDRFFAFIDVLFERQQTWSHGADPQAELIKLAKLAGLGDEKAKACLDDQQVMDRLLEGRAEAEQQHGISSTPSFLVNETKIEGTKSYEQFRQILEDAA